MSNDQEYYGIWSGANLIDSIFMMSTILLMFTFFIIRLIVPFTLTEISIWIFIVETYFLGFVILKQKLKVKHSNAVRHLKFAYSGVWRDFSHYEKILFGVKDWYIIDIDWTTDMLKELFETSYFTSIRNEIENWQRLETVHRPTSLPYKTDELKNDNGEEGKLVEIEPYSTFNLEDVTEDMIGKISKYKIAIGALNEEYKYTDSDLSFDRICIITDTNIEQSLKCKPSLAIHEGYPVNIDQVECAFTQIGIILPEIPLYVLTWSENMSKKLLEPALDSSMITYIEMKVLEKYVYMLRSFSKQASMSLKQSETIAGMYYDAWDDLIQEVEDLELTKLLGSEGINTLKIQENSKKMGQYKLSIYLLLSVVGILIFMIIFSLF